MHKRDCSFLTYLQTGYAIATQRMTFENQPILAYVQSPPTQMHIKISGNTGSKFTKSVSMVNFSLTVKKYDGLNAAIRVVIRPPVVE